MMLTDGEKVEMASLADQCTAVWRSFMAAHSLHSPTA
jgi:hypothetical protein